MKNTKNHTLLCCSRWIFRAQVSHKSGFAADLHSDSNTSLRMRSFGSDDQRSCSLVIIVSHCTTFCPKSRILPGSGRSATTALTNNFTGTFLYFHQRGHQFPSLSSAERKRENLRPASLKINLPHRARLQTRALYIFST